MSGAFHDLGSRQDVPSIGKIRLRDSITSSAAESTSIQTKLRTALSVNAIRIMDLFAEWDTNGDNSVTKAEFRKAMAELGFNESRPHIDAVFDSFDADHSGTITYKELLRGLRRNEDLPMANPSTRDDSPERGGRKTRKFSMAVRIEDSDQSPEAVLQRSLRDALMANSARVIDLFHEWDEDGNGMVSKDEFLRALPLLGLQVKAKDAETLFRSFDPDGSGSIELRELQSALREKKRFGAGPAVAGRKGVKRHSKVKRGMHLLGRPLEDTDGMDEAQETPLHN